MSDIPAVRNLNAIRYIRHSIDRNTPVSVHYLLAILTGGKC